MEQEEEKVTDPWFSLHRKALAQSASSSDSSSSAVSSQVSHWFTWETNHSSDV